MSIVTKTGDLGATGLMYNRRVSKCHPLVEAYGSIDELNAALGLARATAEHDFIRDNLLAIQKDLVTLMGELATGEEDLSRYVQDGYSLVTAELTARLEKLVTEIEAQEITYRGWATPGASGHSAALDVARTTCRRAERRVVELGLETEIPPLVVIYLNRLSDLLFTLARVANKRDGAGEVTW